MKKNRLLGIFLLCAVNTFLCISCDTEKNIESPDKNFFLKMYGEDGDQHGVDILVLDNGELLLLGNSQHQNTSRIYLLKVDNEGNIINEWRYGEVGGFNVAKDIEKTSTGFAILATVRTPAAGTDAKLLRISPDGVLMDSVVYGHPQNDDAVSVTALLDDGFIITGSTTRDTTEQDPLNPPIDPEAFSNIFHYRFDAQLQLLENWYQLYGDLSKSDYGTKAIQFSSDTIYIFGYSDLLNNDGRMNLQYYSLSSDGIPSNNAGTLGEFLDNTRSSFVCQLPEEMGKRILVVSTVEKNQTVTLHVSTLRTPLRFNSQNDRAIDTDIVIGTIKLEGVSAAAALHGGPLGYLLLGNEERTLGTNIWLTKIDQSARVLWSVSLGSERENDRGAAVAELPDGKIMVLGTVGIGDNQSKMALFKLNSTGQLRE